MKHTVIPVASAAFLASTIMLAGCGGTSSQTGSPPASSVSGTAAIALPVDASPNWFFPVESATTFSIYNSQVSFWMYRPLLYITSKDSIDLSRSIASKVLSNRTGTQYTITLGNKYKWSNGHPVTAQDVVFSWNIIKAASSGASSIPWTYGGAGIGGVPGEWSSVKAAGPKKVVVTLTRPVNENWFEHNGLGQIVPVPKSVWDKYGSNWPKELSYIKGLANSPQAPQYKVVDGPYKFSDMQPNNYWAFVANPTYGGHRSSLKKIVYQYETSSAAEFLALKSGTITAGYLPNSDWSSQKSLSKDKLYVQYPFGFNYLVPNLNTKAMGGLGPTFNKLYVREALQMGMNQHGIIGLNHGYGVVEDTTVPSQPHTIFYDAKLAKPLVRFNPQAGKHLLESHGWHEIKGVMTRHGIRLAFPVIYSSGSSLLTNEMQILKQDWAKEGIAITLDPQQFNTVISTGTAQTPSKWDMMNWGGGWTYEPDYYPSGGGLLATGSASNSGSYSSSTMNHLIKATYNPGTTTQNLKALFAYEAYARKTIPDLWLPWLPTFNEYSTQISGFQKSSNPVTDLISPNYWTIK